MWFAPFIYAYIFWGTFFGWHFGGKLWARLGDISANWPWWWGFIFLSLKITVSLMIGCFGGGIIQFLTYKNMIERQLQISGHTETDKNS
jgi:hypothetical protein